MKISVITVCYNAERTIRAAMDSVFAQRGVEVEYIVVDGGSKDGTVGIVREQAQLADSGWRIAVGGEQRDRGVVEFKWISEPDEGMYDAINKGIKMATGDVVGILNADDMLEFPGTLKHIADMFADGIDVVYADVRFVKADLVTTVRYYGAAKWRPYMHNWGYMPPHPSVYIRRERLLQLGGYKLGYQISADFELMVRYLCRQRLKAAYLPESVVKMRMGGKSTCGWRANLKLNLENVRANRENGYFCCLAMMAPKYLFKIWGFVLPRLR